MTEHKKYELGGVHFIVVDGEVYCRYADVYEEDQDQDDEPDEEEEEDEEVVVTTPKRRG